MALAEHWLLFDYNKIMASFILLSRQQSKFENWNLESLVEIWELSSSQTTRFSVATPLEAYHRRSPRSTPARYRYVSLALLSKLV
jgi:hypothetical protein